MNNPVREESVLFDQELIDRRDARRTDCRISGQIFFAGAFLADCLVKNISASGMMLQVKAGQWLPDTFEVQSDSFDQPIKVHRSWLSKGTLGVRAS